MRGQTHIRDRNIGTGLQKMKVFYFRPQACYFLKEFHSSYLKFIRLGGQLYRLIYIIS
jgi:hypothetical protein